MDGWIHVTSLVDLGNQIWRPTILSKGSITRFYASGGEEGGTVIVSAGERVVVRESVPGVAQLLGLQSDGEHFFESIDILRLSVRASNCLETAGIRTLGALLATRPRDLLQIRNFGETTLVEISEKLAERGLQLLGQ